MAYVNQNYTNPNEDENTTNVLGSNAPAQNPQQAPNQAPAQPSMGMGSTTIGQSGPSQQPSQAPQKPKQPASSGMFTNIKKYMQANQQGGQRVGQAVEQDTSRRATQIGQQVQQQQGQYQGQIAQQQALRDTAGQQAQQTLAQAQQTGKIAPTSISDFRRLATGEQKFEDVNPLDLSQAEYKAQELQRRGEGLKSFEGRSGLLSDIFGKQKEYTAGQSSLDNLLFQGSPALQETKQRAGDIISGASQGIQAGKQDSQQRFADLQNANRQFAEDLQRRATEGTSSSLSDIDRAVEQAKQARQKLYQQEVGGALGALQNRITGTASKLDEKAALQRLVNDPDVFSKRIIQSAASQLGLKPEMGVRAPSGVMTSAKAYSQDQLDQAKQALLQGKVDLNKVSIYGDASGFDPLIKRVLGINTDEQKLLGLTPEDYNTFYQDLGAKNSMFAGSDPGLNIGQVLNMIKQTQQGATKKATDYAASYLKDLGINQNLSKIAQGADLTRETAANQQQLARYNTLAQLAGVGQKDLAVKQTGAQKISDSQLKKLSANLRKLAASEKKVS